MPRPKRYFHCSQELIADPEVWEFIKEFGDRAIMTWLQILIYLDRTDNQWRLVGDWLAVLSRSVRQSSANLRRQIGWMTAKGWLQVGEVAADGSPLLLKASNWLKYNKTQVHKNPEWIPVQGSIGVPLLSYPNHSSPNQEEKSIVREVKKRSRTAALPDPEWIQSLKENPVYAGVNVDLEYRKASAWYPEHRRVCTRKAFVNWLIKAMNDKPLTSVQQNSHRPTKVVL